MWSPRCALQCIKLYNLVYRLLLDCISPVQNSACDKLQSTTSFAKWPICFRLLWEESWFTSHTRILLSKISHEPPKVSPLSFNFWSCMWHLLLGAHCLLVNSCPHTSSFWRICSWWFHVLLWSTASSFFKKSSGWRSCTVIGLLLGMFKALNPSFSNNQTDRHLFRIYLFLVYVHECFASIYVTAPCACSTHWRPEEGIRTPGARVPDNCEPPFRC